VRDKMTIARDLAKEEKDVIISQRTRELKEANEAIAVLTGERAAAAEQRIELDKANALVLTLKAQRAEVRAERSRTHGKLGGRPPPSAHRHGSRRARDAHKTRVGFCATARLLGVIGTVDEGDELSLEVIMGALKFGGYLPLVWESEEV
jgi:hypothetical protein